MGFLMPIAGSFLSAGGFNTAFGWAMASMAANLVFGKPIEGPRLKDLSVQTSDVNQIIPVFFGTTRVAGNIIWSKRIKETRKRSKGGKGGGKVDNYKYSWSGAILIGKKIDDVLEIWANSTKILEHKNGEWVGYDLTYNPATGAWEGDKIRIYTGTDTQLPDPLIEADKGVGKTPAFRGRSYITFDNFPLEEYGRAVPNFTFVVKRNVFLVKDIATELCGLANIKPEDVNFDSFGTKAVEGMVINQRGACKNYLNMLERLHDNIICEYDFMMQSRSLKDLNTLALNASDVNVIEENSERGYLQIDKLHALEIANRIDVEYMDSTRNYNKNSQGFARQIVESLSKEIVTYPVTMNGGVARKCAETELVRRWSERKTYTLNVGIRGLHLIPGDLLLFSTRTGNETIRIEEITKRMFGTITIKGCQHDRTVYQRPTLSTIDIAVPPSEVALYAEPIVKIFETSPLLDSHVDKVGFYAVACPLPNSYYASTVITHGDIIGVPSYVNPAGTSAVIDFDSPIGAIVGTLGNFALSDLPWDNSVITVDINSGELASTDDEDIFVNQANMALIGKELIHYKTATFVTDLMDGKKRYHLTNLLRGVRGTEVHMDTHVANEDFVVVNEGAVFVELQHTSLGKTLELVTNYGTEISGGVGSVTHTVRGENLKPFAPAGTEYLYDEDGLLISWHKRSRYTDTYLETGFDVPDSLNYDLNEYQIDILNEAEDVIRSLTSTVESTLYSAANIAEDEFVEDDTIYVRIYRKTSLSCPASPLGLGHSLLESFTIPLPPEEPEEP